MPKFQPTHLVVIRGQAIPVHQWATGAVAFFFVEGEQEVTDSTFRMVEGSDKIYRRRWQGNTADSLVEIPDSRLASYGEPKRIVKLGSWDWKDPPSAEDYNRLLAPFGIFVYEVETGDDSNTFIFSSEKLSKKEQAAEYENNIGG